MNKKYAKLNKVFITQKRIKSGWLKTIFRNSNLRYIKKILKERFIW